MPARTAGRGGALDERPFHAWLRTELTGPSRGLLGLGDDAAAVPTPPGLVAVLTTDALVEGTHFRADSPPDLVGAAAANVSLSDLAAKGARPVALLLALLAPPGTPRRWAEAVVRGADGAGRRAGAPLVGGDTKPSPTPTVVSFAMGWGRPDRLAPRTGARPGDILATTGTVGQGGLAAHRLRVAPKAGPRHRRALRDLLTVTPRVAEGMALVPHAHAMLDTSDGIADAVHLLAEASGCRILVEDRRLPYVAGLSAAARTAPGRRRIAFYGGDYELLAAIPASSLAAATRAVQEAGGRLTPVGQVVSGAGAGLQTAGRIVPLPSGGWRPFGARRTDLP